MKLLSISRQESYSRGELLMRTLFGAIYIGVPHMLAMIFPSILAAIYSFLTLFSLLFAGKYPENWFEYQVKMTKWNVRLMASMSNMIDGYPEIGMNKDNDKVKVEIPYNDSITRGAFLIRFLFGALYVGVPHGFCLGFRMIAQSFVGLIAFLAILFKGQYPESLFTFTEGSMRWQLAVGAYMGYLTNDYPKFNGSQE